MSVSMSDTHYNMECRMFMHLLTIHNDKFEIGMSLNSQVTFIYIALNTYCIKAASQ